METDSAALRPEWSRRKRKWAETIQAHVVAGWEIHDIDACLDALMALSDFESESQADEVAFDQGFE